MLRFTIVLMFAVASSTADDYFDLDEKCDSWKSMERMTSAMNDLHACMEDAVDFNELLMRTNEAKKFSEVRRLFENVCGEVPILRQCASEFLDAVSPCYNETQKTYFKLIMDRSDKMAELMCANNGKRLANFVYQGGPECLAKINVELMECMEGLVQNKNDIFSNFDPMYLLNNIPECKDTDKLRKCFDHHAKKCHSATISHFVHSVTKHLIICKKRGQISF